ncbi:capsular polysaccharide synthesis protein [Weissella hellenica]|uniref:Capsular polysaccharide synthesis protein n=1 Tax=Weissella hellenica TaxID=46256 RepID=A0A4Y4G926_WEIHE|nr:capsular polysaccharide synthesis protein [Weissella hellenica]NKY67686.1 hypothetical protein [Weissella hellenica]GED36840.1 hypothetical protein WHE01_17440 [Weissella hellenica]SCC09946.1 Capsular polysaccharide synthesis protein [Weissella hellenica]
MKINAIPINNLTSKETDVSESDVFIPDRVSAVMEKSMVSVTSNSTTNNDTSIYIGGRDKNQFKFGLRPGHEYSLICNVSIDEVLSGEIIKDALTMTAIPVVNSRPIWGYAISNSAPNIKGSYNLIVDFKIPDDADSLWIRLSSGMLKGSGKVSWGNIGYIEKKLDKGIQNNLKKYLSSGRLKNLISIKNFEITVNENLISEYAITELTHNELSDIIDFAGINNINFSEIKDARRYLKNFENNSDEDVPKILKSIFNKYKFDYNYFFSIHPNNAFQRFRTLVWLINNFDNIKNIDDRKITKKNVNFPEYIFTYWNDGFQNAPGIVQSAHKYLSNSLSKIKLVSLNDKNIEFYIDVPVYAKKLRNKSIAHLSDFYRIALLNKYGGAWIDSTVMVGENFENKLCDLYLNNKNSIVTPRYGNEEKLQSSQGISNWFISVVEDHNRLISLQYNDILLWLKDHDEFSYYYMFHALWDFLICIDEPSKLNWEKSGYVSAYKSHIIQKNMFSTVNKDFIDILEDNLVNKMTYKYNESRNSSQSLLSYVGRM